MTFSAFGNILFFNVVCDENGWGLCLYSLQDQRGYGQGRGEDEWHAPQRPQSVCGQIQDSKEQEECGAKAKFTSV